MRSTSVSVAHASSTGTLDGEVVHEFHRRRSSRVSMSAGLPGHATSGDEVGATSEQRPRAVVAGRREQRPHRRPRGAPGCGGGRRRWRRRSGVAWHVGDGRATPSAGISGWSARPTTTASWPVLAGHAPTAARSDVIWPSAHAGLRISVTPAGRSSSTAPTTTIVSSRPALERGVDGPARRAAGRGTAPAACARRPRSGCRPRRPAPRQRSSSPPGGGVGAATRV